MDLVDDAGFKRARAGDVTPVLNIVPRRYQKNLIERVLEANKVLFLFSFC